VALRVAPMPSATVRERYSDGTILYVTCAVSADSVTDQNPYRQSPIWLQTQGGSYVSLLYLQVEGQAAMPNCQAGQPDLTLTINGSN
jgi:hypothetical protein